MIDVYHSRRGKFRKCIYWLRETNNVKPEELIHKISPAGFFWAVEDSGIAQQNNNVNGNVMFDKTMVTLKTDDEVEDITQNCIVKYRNLIWLVNDVQKQLHNKETEFDIKIHATTYLTLRR